MDANTYFLNQKLDHEEKYLSWVESNEERLLEEYKESLEFYNVSDEWLNDRYEREFNG